MMLLIARLGLVGLIGISVLAIFGRVWLGSIKTQPVAVQSLNVQVGSTASEVLAKLNPQLTSRARAIVFSLYPQLVLCAAWQVCLFARNDSFGSIS